MVFKLGKFSSKQSYTFFWGGGYVGSSLLRAGFSSCSMLSSCGTGAWEPSGFSSCGAQALGPPALVVVALRLSCSPSIGSCGTQAQLLRSMWDLPRTGIEPVSPALAGGFLTTAPRGKSQSYTLKSKGFLPFNSLSLKERCYNFLSLNCAIQYCSHSLHVAIDI